MPDQHFEVQNYADRELTIRVTDRFGGAGDDRKIEVVDGNGVVLGNLKKSTMKLEWNAVARDLGVLVLTLASAHVRVETLHTKDL